MKPDSNQPASSPRSIIIWKQPRPSVISDRPMIVDAAAFFVLLPGRIFDHDGDEKHATMPTGTLMKKIQRQVAWSVM